MGRGWQIELMRSEVRRFSFLLVENLPRIQPIVVVMVSHIFVLRSLLHRLHVVDYHQTFLLSLSHYVFFCRGVILKLWFFQTELIVIKGLFFYQKSLLIIELDGRTVLFSAHFEINLGLMVMMHFVLLQRHYLDFILYAYERLLIQIKSFHVVFNIRKLVFLL